jgi:hypothetical protein
MKRRFFELIVGVVVICVVALQPGFAQGKDRGKDKGTKEQPAAISEKTRPGQEGIKVHGHWVVEVRNPDGTLVSHREFENALVGSGAGLLSQVLARSASVGYWGVWLSGQPGPCTAPSVQYGSLPIPCVITEGPAVSAPSTATAGWYFTLSISSTSAGTVMTGTVTASNASSINNVQTGSLVCPSNDAPATACLNGINNVWSTFTSATVSPAINVLAGQTIAVTVTISFS